MVTSGNIFMHIYSEITYLPELHIIQWYNYHKYLLPLLLPLYYYYNYYCCQYHYHNHYYIFILCHRQCNSGQRYLPAEGVT